MTPANCGFRSRLIDMLKLIHNGRPGDLAFHTRSGTTSKASRTAFLEYAKEARATPEATYIERQYILSELLTLLKTKRPKFCVGRRIPSVRLARWLSFSRRIPTARFVEQRIEPQAYFLDLEGHPMDDDRLFFRPRRGAPLDDLVCRPMRG